MVYGNTEYKINPIKISSFDPKEAIKAWYSQGQVSQSKQTLVLL